MSKKDYILLAQALKDSKPVNIPKFLADLPETVKWGQGTIDQWKMDVEMITLTLAQQNPRFNRDRFLHACGYTS